MNEIARPALAGLESIAAENLPRVLSVNGAQTSVGLTKSYLDHLEDLPPTVGRFLGDSGSGPGKARRASANASLEEQ